MTHESLVNRDWSHIVARLGGGAHLELSARQTKAFLRARVIENAADLLRMILAYCLGERGLRSTTAWASAVGLVDIPNVALLYRLRQCGDWLAFLVGQTLAFDAPKAAQGRLIRLIDATTVPKAGALAKTTNSLWRIHSAFDLPNERFGFFELTDEKGGERLDRIPVVAGEIRIGDRAYLQPDRIGEILDAGADIVVRAGWRNARWLEADGEPADMLAILRKGAERGLIDQPIFIARNRRAARLASRRRQEVAASRRDRTPQGAKAGCERETPSLEGDAHRGRMGHHPHRSRPKPSRPRTSWRSIACAGASNSRSSA